MSIVQFYVIALSFLGGVFVATFLYFSLPVSTWLVTISFFLILIWYRSPTAPSYRNTLLGALFLLAFSLGTLRVTGAEWKFQNSSFEQYVGTDITVTGVIVVEPDVRERSTFLELKTDQGKLLVLVDRYEIVSYGDLVLIEGKLTKPESFETDLGRTFNYPGYLKAKGIEYQISFADIEVLKSGEGNPVLTSLFRFKHFFIDSIESALPEPVSGLGEGMLLGVKEALSDDLETIFRKTGIIHIVVLSGYNIMLVVIFVMYILGRFLSPKPKFFAGILAVILFALLVGMSASVVRASVMVSILLLTEVAGRRYMMLRALILAGVLMVLVNPFLLVYDIGFQLSFLATLGLILIAPHFEYIFKRVSNFLNLRTFFIATVATQIAVLPLLLYQIGEFSLVSVLVNLLVLPMVPVAMLLTFITGLVSIVFPALVAIVAFPTYWSLRYIIDIAVWFADLPLASFIVPPFPFFVVRRKDRSAPKLYGPRIAQADVLRNEELLQAHQKVGKAP